MKRLVALGHFVLVLLVLLFFLLPFAWMVLSSFKSALQIIELPPRLIFMPTLENYANVFGSQHFLRYMWNSTVAGVLSTGLGLLIGLPAAYSIARFKQRGLSLAILVARIVTGSILAFVFSWNNFMFSIVLATNRTKTLPVAVYNFISYAQIDWGGLMAAAVVITLPVLVLALRTQRYVVRGLTAGAIKG
jgi:ABC-type glycerol-3-phosphate transport system permease component